MRNHLITFFLVLISLVVYAQTTKVYLSDIIEEKEGKEYYIHTVQQGQTIYSIAKAYEVGVEEIYFENPGTREGISIDQELWIPTINKETELSREIRMTNFEFFYHIASESDNYQRISTIYDVPVQTLRNVNRGIEEPFRAGEYLKIPVEKRQLPETEEESVSFDPDIDVKPGFRHVVKQGETIYSIARAYNVPVSNLRAVNPGLVAEISIGDRLRIPEVKKGDGGIADKETDQEAKQQDPTLFKHRVKAKETLYSISRKYGVTLQQLFDENPGLSEHINIGQVLLIPKTTIEEPYLTYSPKTRIRLKDIAQLYNVSLDRIREENPSLDRGLFPGMRRIAPYQEVRIPVGRFALDQLEEDEEIVTEKEVLKKDKIPEPSDCRNLKAKIGKTFNVALMVPLYLEDTDSLDVAEFLEKQQSGFYPFRYIDFYEGALIAADSMIKQGMKLKLYVYDVDQTITKTSRVLQAPELRNMDLIIGPFHSRSFDQVAHFAGVFEIPIVNPLSYRKQVVTDYPSAIKVKSDPGRLTQLVPALIPTYYENDKVFLVTHTAYKDADITANLANGLQAVIKPFHKLPNDSLYKLMIDVAHRDTAYTDEDPLPVVSVEGFEVYPEIIEGMLEDSTLFDNKLLRINYMKDSLHPFLNNASPLRNNLVILYGEDKAFVMDAMNRLNEVRDTFNVRIVGLPSIERFNNLDHAQAGNMSLTYFATYFSDYKSNKTKTFIHDFYKRYNTEPGIYGFNGFDITYYFLHALFHLDKRLNSCLEYMPLDLILSRYDFGKNGPGLNYQNTYWNLVRYNGLVKYKLPDPGIEDQTEEK